jgi:excisionase family DNA binding protein
MSKPLTLEEMAKELRRTAKTFRKYVSEYDIPHIRLGRDFLFDRDKVIAYLENRSAAEVKPKSHAKLKTKPADHSDRGRFADALGL